MEVIASGRVRLLRKVQPSKALAPIDVRLAGNTRLVSLSQPMNLKAAVEFEQTRREPQATTQRTQNQ